MDRAGIGRAIVSSAAAITYRNPQPGNEEVAAQIRSHQNRLTGFAVLNPVIRGLARRPHGLSSAIRDARHTAVSSLAQLPAHRSSLSGTGECRDGSRYGDLHTVASRRPATGQLACRYSGCRSRRDREIGCVVSSRSLHPGQRIRVCRLTLGRKNNGLPANYVIDTSLLTAEISNEVGQLIENLGAERVVFGTGMPFHYPGPAFAKLEVLDKTEAVKDRIRWQNAASFLNL